jgi:hypothetical protein
MPENDSPAVRPVRPDDAPFILDLMRRFVSETPATRSRSGV